MAPLETDHLLLHNAFLSPFYPNQEGFATKPVLSHDNNITTSQLKETQKQLIMAKETNKSLDKKLGEIKENTDKQINYLKDQSEKNRALFKEQLETQEKKSQERYNVLKNECLHEKVALQQMIEKNSEQQKIIETELHKKQIEIEQSRGEVRTLEEVLQETKNQQRMLHQENRELNIQIRDKGNQILKWQRGFNPLQQQLQNLQLKIDVLQEEKLILTQEKFQLEKKFKKECIKII